MLVATRSLLSRVGGRDDADRQNFFQPDRPGGLRVTVDRDVWEDMGCPDELTVTVEPGDRLNR